MGTFITFEEFAMGRLMRQEPTTISQESISFQPSTFFKELTMVIAEMKEQPAKQLPDSDFVLRLSGIIKHHTGLKIDVVVDNYQPCIEFPFVDKNNILINDWMRNLIDSHDGMKMIGTADNIVRGTVNLHTAKVTGVFTEVGAKMHLPFDMFSSSKFDASEIAAIMLHEVGHLFTMYEFMSRTVRTNQVLAGLSKVLDKTGSIEEREIVFAKTAEALKLKKDDLPPLGTTSDKSYAELVIVSNLARQTKSELGANIYDMNTWEYLSDQFATRQGAGRECFTALAKLYKGHREFRSTAMYIFVEAVKVLLLLLVPFGGFTLGSFVLMIMMDAEGDGTYDEPVARLRRIRGQIVENLKDRNLSKDDQKRLTDDIAVMDNFLATTNERRQLFGVITDFLSPWNNDSRRFVKLQKDLEGIALNDLFVKSAQLKTLF